MQVKTNGARSRKGGVRSAGPPTADGGMSSEGQEVLALLKQRFAQVLYRTDGMYEIDRRILLFAKEAQALAENNATLEEIIVYRNLPSHLMPEHVRLALRASGTFT